ncbi:MAG TPA: SWIM zinc finger family protein, partial [Microthrixaceae bacterium]|nr:SWIM zinc finger family protein [Microthrixaceae bacterium]
MSGPVPRLELSDPGLFAGYDPRSVERGIRYAADGRVELIDVGDGWATADVAGTRPTPYEVDISWSVTARGVSVADDCTCPLGGSCKHAVAVIVEVARHTNASV